MCTADRLGQLGINKLPTINHFHMAGPPSGHAACDTSLWHVRLVATRLVTLLYGMSALWPRGL